MLSHMIARQLKVPHFIISVNHPIDSLERLLFAKHGSVYAGHAITDVRKIQNEDERLELIKRINNEFLVPLSSHNHLVTFIPDTIDETPALSAESYQDLISKLWPRDWLSQKPIMESPQKSLGEQYFDELRSSIEHNRNAYEDVIFGQISDRDYRLVNQVRNFIFTLTKEVTSSQGVEAEFAHARSASNKGVYFFNPDKLARGSEAKNSPNWAKNVTAESDRLEKLIDSITEPPLLDSLFEF